MEKEQPKANDASAPDKRRTLLGSVWVGVKFLAGGRVGWFPGIFPWGEIAKNGRYIWGLTRAVRRGPEPDSRLRFLGDDAIDMAATAFSYGISVEELHQRLLDRRRETARNAYVAFGLGWLSFIFLLLRMATIPWTASQIIPSLEFLPFIALFFVLAFRSALMNYRVRSRSRLSAGQYLRVEEGFWPR